MLDEKLKVYLDTSVISYLDQDDAIDKRGITLRLWKKFKTKCYDIYLSSVTIIEIDDCQTTKRDYLHSKLEEINYTRLILDKKALEISKSIISMKILTEKSYEDCQHIAIALVNNCDIILSWNFKHLVNVKTINGIREISRIQNYKNINILSPLTLLEMEV